MKLVGSVFLVGVALLAACASDNAPQIPANKLPADHTKENLLEFNKQYMEFEEEEMRRYADSLNLAVQKDDNGIRYMLLSASIGHKPVVGDTVDITYSVKLLSGRACDKLTDRNTRVPLGQGKLPKGIEWGVEQLTPHGAGFFIIPAMLAYGVSGMDNCVPPYSPICCTITLNKIHKAK